MEGWTWLLSAGLVMPDPSQSTGSGWCVRTRRGSAVGEHLSEAALKAEIALSRDLHHRTLQAPPWEFFGRGYFDSAVSEACKAIEVRVRQLGGFPDHLLGRKLVPQAVNRSGGPVVDP